MGGGTGSAGHSKGTPGGGLTRCRPGRRVAITPCPVSFTLLFERIYKGSLCIKIYILNGNTLRNLTQVELEALRGLWSLVPPGLGHTPVVI